MLEGTDTVQDNALSAYLDGEKVGQMEGSQLWTHPNRIGIGNVNGQTKFHDGIGTNSRHGLAGSVDEFQLFNTALDDNQVQQLAGTLA